MDGPPRFLGPGQHLSHGERRGLYERNRRGGMFYLIIAVPRHRCLDTSGVVSKVFWVVAGLSLSWP